MAEDWDQRWDAGARTFYIAEVVRQSAYALAALDQALEAAEVRDRSEAWPAVQAFLTATANVSKLLWPVRSDRDNRESRWRKFRGERLRVELGIADSSVLPDRDVRNSAEHFDERIDDLVRDQEISESWTAAQAEDFTRLPAPFRAVDLETGEIIAGHDRMAFAPVVAELKALLERCAAVEPQAIGQHDVVAMMATLRWPPLPSIFVPSERPDEPVTAGAELDRSGPRTLEDLVAKVAERLQVEQSGREETPDKAQN